MDIYLTHSERRFLQMLSEPGATISVGLTVGADLRRRGFVRIAKFARYGITEEGRAALAAPPSPRRRPPRQHKTSWAIF